MASRCNPLFLLPRTPRQSLWLLTLILTMTWPFSDSGRAAPIQLRGEVGGKVTFHCPVAKQRKITFLYFQRDQIFVNGYHAFKNVSQLAWKNTRVDDDKTTMHMYNLNISHNGDYQCHILYSDSHMPDSNIGLHLRVTANFSKPVHTVHCREENGHFSCQVTCVSHGGYPGTEVMWNVLESQMWKVVNSSEMSDPDTMRVNSSSTAYFNCSHGKPTYLSCFVGDVTSDMFSVCDTSPHEKPTDTLYVISAVCVVVVVVVVMVTFLLWYKCKKGQSGTATAATVATTTVEWQVDGCEEELTILNEKKEGKEAP